MMHPQRIYARLVSLGVGMMVGTVANYYVGLNTQHEAMVGWAVGSTVIAVAGGYYLWTRQHWDNL
jgi:hypothetical protein